MTLTYPIINRARRILWLVTGARRPRMLVRLRDGDRSIPAGRTCVGIAPSSSPIGGRGAARQQATTLEA